MLSGFFADMVDQSANKKTTPRWSTEGLTTIGIAVLAASAQAEAAQKLASQLVGEFSNVVQLFLMVFAILWCVTVIRSKVSTTGITVTAVDAGTPQEDITFTYSQVVRFAAKAGMLVLIALIPSKVGAIAAELSPLPVAIYGYIYEGQDKPVDSARVWLVSRTGADITDGTWFTDSRGFYLVKAVRKVRRSDSVKIIPDQCNRELRLSLAEPNELRPGAPSQSVPPSESVPTFIHHISCEEKR